MTTEQVVRLPIADLHDSPTNPRLRYSEVYLAELAADIKSHGRVLQPIVVRPRVPALFQGTNDPDAAVGWEIVFGHCRRRGAELAGMTMVPGIIRSMTDLEVRRAQISENLQRKDVHPFEEAESFRALMAEHGETAESIVASTGKSRSYVYGRLKLLQACPAVRDACLDGTFGSEVALLIARLREVKLQERALNDIKGKCINIADGGNESFRRIRDLLVERYTLDLSKAPFPVEDAELLPDASPCSSCPKRSGNAPEFEDVTTSTKRHQWSSTPVGADVCTDPDCFAAKKAAHFKREATALAEKHKGSRAILDGNKARSAIGADGKVKGAYVALSEVKAQLAQAKTAAQKDPKIVPPLITIIQDPRTGKTVEAVKISELVAAGVRKETVQSKKAVDTWEERNRRDQEERKQREEKAKAKTAEHLALLRRVRVAADARPRDAEDLKLVTFAAMSGVDHFDRETLAQLWEKKSFEALRQAVGSMPIEQLHVLLLDCALIQDVTGKSYRLDDKPKTLLAVAKRYGVPLAAPNDTPPPSKAARAAEVAKTAAPKGKAKSKAATPSKAAQAKKVAKPTAADPDTVGAAPRVPEAMHDQAGSAGEVNMDADGSAAVGSTAEVAAATEGVAE